MRIDVKKYLFAGLQSDKRQFFEEAQKLGLIEFVPLQRTLKGEVSSDAQEVLDAIKILNRFPAAQKEEMSSPSLQDEIVQKILHSKRSLDKAIEEKKNLEIEIDRFAPLGVYSKKDIQWIEEEGKRKIQFFCVKHESVRERPEGFFFLKNHNGLDYFMTISPEGIQTNEMIELKPQAPLQELEHQVKRLNKEINDCETRLKNYAKYSDDLHQRLLSKFDHSHLIRAEDCAYLVADEKLFVVEGWVPADKLDALQTIAGKMRVHVSEVAIESRDAIPTYLENQGLARIGEDLVNIYDTPSTDDKDPSLWVLFFFALFFSMIIGDGGYGLVLLLGALYFKFKDSEFSLQSRRFIDLTLILGSFCIAWGVLTTSFFGISFSPDHPIRKASLLTRMVEMKAEYHFNQMDAVAIKWINAFPDLKGVQNSNELLLNAVKIDPKTDAVSYELLDEFSNSLLLELALFIGVIHLSLSFLRNIKRNPSGIGWVLCMFGAYLYFPTFLDVTSLIHFALGVDPVKGAEIGFWLMWGGMGSAVIISVIKNKLFGLLECINVLQIFGDVMSYLRLYALGLSGALVINTVNELASGMNVVLAGLLLICAHCLNLVLCIMGGAIHGLRLNFLEWYHYCFDGGGKQFNPLKKHT